MTTPFADIVMGMDLAALGLGDLLALNTRLSAMRDAAGGELKAAITTYAVDVNAWISRRARERESTLSAARKRDPEATAKHQRVAAETFSGELEQAFITRVEELIRKQGGR